MKSLLAFLSGFFLTVIVFVSGAAVTIVYLTAEPVPVRRSNASASALTNEPVRMVEANQDSTTLASQSGPESSGMATQVRSHSQIHKNEFSYEQAIDPVTTASAVPESSLEPAPKLSAAHVAWCSERYRSYDPGDNSYNAYSGERRECVSPYLNGADGSDLAEQETNTVSASAEGSSATEDDSYNGETQNAFFDPEHVRSCFARYRSYRPEDNTYQPYGGGPRQQCE